MKTEIIDNKLFCIIENEAEFEDFLIDNKLLTQSCIIIQISIILLMNSIKMKSKTLIKK